jgi:hypothetical protein
MMRGDRFLRVFECDHVGEVRRAIVLIGVSAIVFIGMRLEKVIVFCEGDRLSLGRLEEAIVWWCG